MQQEQVFLLPTGALYHNIPINSQISPQKSGDLQPTWKPFIWGLVEMAILALVFYITLFIQFPGRNDCLAPDGQSDLCYCEAFSSGPVKEVSNTYSALGFSVAGFGILYSLTRSQKSVNLMTSSVEYPTVYGFLAIFLGPGSMFFHSTLSTFGVFMDTFSMYSWLGFVFVFNIMRLTSISLTFAAIFYLVFQISLNVVQWNMGGDWVFTFLVVVAVFSEIAVFLKKWKKWDWGSYLWFVGGLVSFGVAYYVWKQARTGGPLCFPHSIVQGHAIWHILTAVTVACIYMYLSTTTDPDKFSCNGKNAKESYLPN